jgi:hypothetical protein
VFGSLTDDWWRVGSLPHPSAESHIEWPASKGISSEYRGGQHALIDRALTRKIQTIGTKGKRETAVRGTPIGRPSAACGKPLQPMWPGTGSCSPSIRLFLSARTPPCRASDCSTRVVSSQLRPIILREITETCQFLPVDRKAYWLPGTGGNRGITHPLSNRARLPAPQSQLPAISHNRAAAVQRHPSSKIEVKYNLARLLSLSELFWVRMPRVVKGSHRAEVNERAKQGNVPLEGEGEEYDGEESVEEGEDEENTKPGPPCLVRLTSTRSEDK